ncbi:MAG: PQQ-binding-like beta-propeller repeat protein [Desulfobacterales bacterium]
MKNQKISLKALFISFMISVWGLLVAPLTVFSVSTCDDQAEKMLELSGIQGGLVVHLNCSDGKLTEALRINDAFLVHGLDKNDDNVRAARQYIMSKKQYGPVSVDRLVGNNLPYTDNLVNLLVAEDLGGVSMDEVMRVLCPDGVALIKNTNAWEKMVKPRPEDMDEWTHYLHDVDGNMVSQDKQIGPLKHFQWIGSPKWARHHDVMASMSALVSANGRIFYIFDEGPTESIQMPPKWTLIARDAFNGTILWKRPIEKWQNHLFPLKSGPAHLPRRLVAVGNRVFVTLGIDAPVTEIDAATGKTIRTFSKSEKTSEILFSDDTLFFVVGRPEKKDETYKAKHTWVWENPKTARNEWAWSGEVRHIMAVDADNGNILWMKDYSVAPLTLTSGKEAVYFYDGDAVVSIDRKAGKEIWRSQSIKREPVITTAYAPRMVVSEDVVLISAEKGWTTALSSSDGELLWRERQQPSGHYSPEDMLVIDGLVWSGATLWTMNSGTFIGRDLHTGEIKNQFSPNVHTYWFHQRCYPSKATEKYILPSRTGIEFVDHENEQWQINHYVRGGCLYGILPANGLIYAPPHACACYMESKLNGFNALAPAFPSEPDLNSIREEDRLEKGPAYHSPIVDDASPQDWPTYRHDAKRSGFTPSAVSPDMERRWRMTLGGKLSSPVIAGNRVYVSKVDEHTIFAMDAADGKILWEFTSGGRIDSPPTLYRGRVLFGSADGYVYSLKATDGSLIWRYRAAPLDRRIMAFEQLESMWPVSGSVLIQDERLYCVAGRSMFLDGGMRLIQLNPETGVKIAETILDETDPQSGKNLQAFTRNLTMPVALPDVLSSDGKYIYMRSQQFDLSGNRTQIAPRNPLDQIGEGIHVFSPGGFLDDSLFFRTYMMYGKSIISGWGAWAMPARLAPSGRLIVMDDETIYGFGRKPEYLSECTVLEYMLYAADKKGSEENIRQVVMSERQMNAAAAPRKEFMASSADWKLRQGFPLKARSAAAYRWIVDSPSVQARAMIAADKMILVAGPPDVFDEEEAFFQPDDPTIQKQLFEQNALLEGEKGAVIRAVSTSDGKQLAQYPLDALPVWDGMAAAGGRLVLSTMAGEVVCFDKKEK